MVKSTIMSSNPTTMVVAIILVGLMLAYAENDPGPDQMEKVQQCSKQDISVVQGPTGTLPNGIPTYGVEITNTGNVAVTNVHLNCGWFSSATLVNPKIFERLEYNDCLVNDGNPLDSGLIISFQYATTFKYPLSVSSVAC